MFTPTRCTASKQPHTQFMQKTPQTSTFAVSFYAKRQLYKKYKFFLKFCWQNTKLLVLYRSCPVEGQLKKNLIYALSRVVEGTALWSPATCCECKVPNPTVFDRQMRSWLPLFDSADRWGFFFLSETSHSFQTIFYYLKGGTIIMARHLFTSESKQ